MKSIDNNFKELLKTLEPKRIQFLKGLNFSNIPGEDENAFITQIKMINDIISSNSNKIDMATINAVQKFTSSILLSEKYKIYILKKKSKRTKNKAILIKHSNNKLKNNDYMNNPIRHSNDSNNNDAYIRKFNGMNPYKLIEHIRQKFKQEVSYNYIEKVWASDKEISPIYNQNGTLKTNTQTYKEIL